MFFGLTVEKLFLIGVVGALVVGPERLPELSRRLAQAVQTAKAALARTTARMRDEVGPELGDVDWQKLDPRQYDPRRVVREALLEPASTFQPLPPALPDPAVPGPGLPRPGLSEPAAPGPLRPGAEAPGPVGPGAEVLGPEVLGSAPDPAAPGSALLGPTAARDATASDPARVS